jgi:hypothetical protein
MVGKTSPKGINIDVDFPWVWGWFKLRLFISVVDGMINKQSQKVPPRSIISQIP